MKVSLQNALPYCVKEHKACVGWVQTYFRDCLCNVRDDLSFGYGVISLVCRAVAEIPQIITNFRTKSSHGVSLLFLLAWVVGDIFNLVGCLLEPATLYTTTTLALVSQSLYYDYVHRWLKNRKKLQDYSHEQDQFEDAKRTLRPPKQATDSGIPIPNRTHKEYSQRREFYYTSARSLAGSATPPRRSNLWPVIRSGPCALGINDDDDNDNTILIPSKNSIAQPKPIPRSASYGTFLATSLNLPRQNKAVTMQAYVGLTAKKLLQEQGSESYVFRQCLGWMMAAIYMGGRIPQIWLNIKKGSVEGLNPLMFIFALIANTRYVLSIVVRTSEWDKIKANMPWLLDAVACVLLDSFIIMQYIYYRYFRKKTSRDSEEYGDYVEATKD